ncbi:MAG: putative undecaprenyl-phosphate N-acetylglucosaminyl 1-phosphate transferase [Phycisphaerae bacterium]|nr:putative undecaprenyl-phosphate N-acetylglucosaminyl 1-phosphate transferase [Phycisphaerae bacterium]
MDRLLEIVQKYQWFGLLALVVSLIATPIAVRVAWKTGVLDIPDTKLKPHARPIPYLGGLAILAGWAAALVVAIVTGQADAKLLLPVLIGGVLMTLIGVVDDIRNVPVKVRLAATSVVIVIVILATRAGLGLVDAVLGPFGVDPPGIVARPLSLLISLVIVLGACNSTNLIDGLDGLCSGVTGIISFGFFLLAAYLAMYDYSRAGDPVRLTLAIAMLGAALGFLPWNFNPAKIFMGDAGSILLGFNCGMIILLFAERGPIRWVIGALMMFAVPIFDTALAMFRRWRSGRSIFEGDRSHFYDQLVQRGFSVRQTVAICYLAATLFAAIGTLVILIRTWHAVFVYLGVCAATALLAWRAGLTDPDAKRGFPVASGPQDVPAGGASS